MNHKENLFQPPEYTAEEINDMFKEEKARALRISTVFEIIGDDYDLSRLRELVEADRDGRVHIGRCVECSHYEGLAVCEYLGDCGGTNWICGWFEPKKSDDAAPKGEQDGKR